MTHFGRVCGDDVDKKKDKPIIADYDDLMAKVNFSHRVCAWLVLFVFLLTVAYFGSWMFGKANVAV
jgi:hypothetical protein